LYVYTGEETVKNSVWRDGMAAVEKLKETSVPERKLADLVPNFCALVRWAAKARFDYVAEMESELLEEKDWDQLVYAPNLAFIMVAGKDFRLSFKVHFCAKHFEKLTKAKQENKKKQALDMMREYCNLTAGAVKLPLIEQNIICGISLPTITSGFDELVFSDRIRLSIFRDCFVLKNDISTIHVSALLECSNASYIERLKQIRTSGEEEEEVEFL
jgi:hypothetical protein